MPCFHPLTAERCSDGSVRVLGAREVEEAAGRRLWLLELPCQRCVGCKLARSRGWAVRAMHEKAFHDHSSFVTLTVDDKHMEEVFPGASLRYAPFQAFMRRLRKRIRERIRFFMCGEYGDQSGRPHYHVILFGADFRHDRLLLKKGEFPLYRSPLLEQLWPYGHSSIGDVSFESAAYVSRYVVKKVTGPMAELVYVDPSTGECFEPEFAHMSLKPGIGYAWFEKFWKEVYSGREVSGAVRMRGHWQKPPRYYDHMLEKYFPAEHDKVIKGREDFAAAHVGDDTIPRLKDRELCEQSRLSLKKRNLV